MSCGPRSRRATLARQEERKRNFRTAVALCCLDETRRFFSCCGHARQLSTPHSKSEQNRLKRSRDMRLLVSPFFSSSFRTLTKTAMHIKRERIN